MQDFKNPKEIIKAPQNILYTVPINIPRSREFPFSTRYLFSNDKISFEI